MATCNLPELALVQAYILQSVQDNFRRRKNFPGPAPLVLHPAESCGAFTGCPWSTPMVSSPSPSTLSALSTFPPLLLHCLRPQARKGKAAHPHFGNTTKCSTTNRGCPHFNERMQVKVFRVMLATTIVRPLLSRSLLHPPPSRRARRWTVVCPFQYQHVCRTVLVSISLATPKRSPRYGILACSIVTSCQRFVMLDRGW